MCAHAVTKDRCENARHSHIKYADSPADDQENTIYGCPCLLTIYHVTTMAAVQYMCVRDEREVQILVETSLSLRKFESQRCKRTGMSQLSSPHIKHIISHRSLCSDTFLHYQLQIIQHFLQNLLDS